MKTFLFSLKFPKIWVVYVFFTWYFEKKWFGRAMGNETIYWDGLFRFLLRLVVDTLFTAVTPAESRPVIWKVPAQTVKEWIQPPWDVPIKCSLFQWSGSGQTQKLCDSRFARVQCLLHAQSSVLPATHIVLILAKGALHSSPFLVLFVNRQRF